LWEKAAPQKSAILVLLHRHCTPDIAFDRMPRRRSVDAVGALGVPDSAVMTFDPFVDHFQPQLVEEKFAEN
jgi:hypothetical protein